MAHSQNYVYTYMYYPRRIDDRHFAATVRHLVFTRPSGGKQLTAASSVLIFNFFVVFIDKILSNWVETFYILEILLLFSGQCQFFAV